MGTTTSTTGSNVSNLQFNPIAQGVYNQLTSGAGNVLGGYINSPFSNAFYSMGAGQSQKGAQQAGANNMAALMQNMLTSGMGGQAGAGFKQAQLAQAGRAGSAMSSQANIQNVLSALQRQMSAAGTGLSYSPQLTGQTGSFQQQQTTGGLGTWLPQVMGAALGGLTGGLGAGMGGLGSFGGGSVGGVSDPALGSPSYMGMGMAGMSPGSMIPPINPVGGMSPLMFGGTPNMWGGGQ